MVDQIVEKKIGVLYNTLAGQISGIHWADCQEEKTVRNRPTSYPVMRTDGVCPGSWGSVPPSEQVWPVSVTFVALWTRSRCSHHLSSGSSRHMLGRNGWLTGHNCFTQLFPNTNFNVCHILCFFNSLVVWWSPISDRINKKLAGLFGTRKTLHSWPSWQWWLPIDMGEWMWELHRCTSNGLLAFQQLQNSVLLCINQLTSI